MDGLAIDADRDITFFQTRFFGRAFRDNLGDACPYVGVLAANANIRKVGRHLANLFRLHDRINVPRVLLEVADTNASQLSGWQPLRNPAELLATVVRQVNSRPGPEFHGRVIRIKPITLAPIRRYQQSVRVFGVHLNVDNPRLVIDKQDSIPGLAAIGRLVQTTFVTRAPQAPQRADVNDVRVLRMDGDPTDLKRLFESHVLPGLATIGRLVDAVSPRRAVAWIRFAGANPHDVRVRWGYLHVANRDRCLMIELVRERGAIVRCLQEPSRSTRRPPRCRVLLIHRKRGDAPTHIGRPNGTPV